ncbi:hypothetical protein ACU8KH_00645 [Lachancea thermotolerans]
MSQRANHEQRADTPPSQFFGYLAGFGALGVVGYAGIKWMYKDTEMEHVFKRERNQGRTSLEPEISDSKASDKTRDV